MDRLVSAGEPPSPSGVQTVDDLVVRLRLLRAWSGQPYREVHRALLRARAARGVPERPVFNTIYRVFQLGRARLDADLVVEVVGILLGDPDGKQDAAGPWRQACRVVAGRASAASVVEVLDRLPDQTTRVVGRDAETARLLGAVRSGRVRAALIEGMAGVGKTTLAVHVADQLVRRGQYPDLRWWVDLRGFDPANPPADPAAVLEVFLRRLGVPVGQIQPLDLAARTARFRELVAGRSALIVLDNAATAAQVEPLLPDRAGCLALVTSRRALTEIPAAELPAVELRAVELSGSERPAGARVVRLELREFGPEDSVALLARAAGPERTAAEPGTLDEIAAAVGQLPLAVALVAARIRAARDWTLADHRDRLVEFGRTHRLEQAVDAAIALSYRDLRDDLQRTFRRIALHPGTELEPYATAVLAGIDLNSARGQLADLARERLLQRLTPDRYALHDLVRSLAIRAAHDHDPASARASAVQDLLEFYRRAARRAVERYAPEEAARSEDRSPTSSPDADAAKLPTFDDARSAVRWLDLERHNLVTTAIHAADHGAPDATARLADLLASHLENAGHYPAALTLHEHAARATDPGARSRALRHLGSIRHRQSRYAEAIEYHQLSRALAAEAGDRLGESRTLGNLGNVYWQCGRPTEAIEAYRTALALTDTTVDPNGVAILQNNLGNTFGGLGRNAEALETYRRAHALFRSLGNRRSEGVALANVAVALQNLGRHEEAIDDLRVALEIALEVGDRRAEGIALTNLGDSLYHAARYDEAIDHQRRALALFRELGARDGEINALTSLGEVFGATERDAEALDVRREALALVERTDEGGLRASALNGLAESLLAVGRTDEALDHRNRALAVATDLGLRREVAQAWAGLGDVHDRLGDTERARELWRQALELCTELGVPEAADLRVRLNSLEP